MEAAGPPILNQARGRCREGQAATALIHPAGPGRGRHALPLPGWRRQRLALPARTARRSPITCTTAAGLKAGKAAATSRAPGLSALA